MDKRIQNGNFPVHLLEGKFIQFAADNIDIIEEIIDGKGTSHATQMVAFQRGEPTGQREQQLPLGKGDFLKIQEELQQLNHPHEAIPRPIREELQQMNHAPEAIARPIPEELQQLNHAPEAIARPIREELQQLNYAPEAIARPIREELQQLNYAPEAIARPMPRIAVDVDLESYEPDPTLTTTANIKDVCWLLTSH